MQHHVADELNVEVPLARVLQRLADEALIRNRSPGRGSSYRFEQLQWQAHVNALALGLKLEADWPHARQIVFSQVGLLDKHLGFLIASEAWQFLFHSAQERQSTGITKYGRLY